MADADGVSDALAGPSVTEPKTLTSQAGTSEERPEKLPRLEEPPAADDATATVQDVPDANRPTDAQILSYENELRAQQQEKPLLGGVEPLASLEADYADGSQIFVAKIQSLKATFASLRRTRQDGNCFYRSFLFGHLESLLLRADKAEVGRMLAVLQGWREKLLQGGFQELVFEDALELFVTLLRDIEEGSLTVAELELRMRDEQTSALMIMLIRFITSCEIQRRSEHFLPFVIGMTDGMMELEDFCRRHVEAMGEESDHIQLVAVADAFQVQVQVVYLDNSGLAGMDCSDALECQIHNFKPEHEQEGTAPTVHVLYRPGHYDILYRNPATA